MVSVRQILDATVFVLLLAIMVGTNIPYGTVDAWWEAPFEIAVFIVTALWVVQVLLRGSWELRRVWVLLPLVLIVVYMFAQSAVWPSWIPIGANRLTTGRTLTIDRYQTYLTARKTLALTLFLGMLLQTVSTPRRLRWLVRVILALGLASAIFGILRQLIQVSDSVEGFILPFLFYGMGYGQYLYHNLFAYLMEMTLAVGLGLILGGGLRRERLLIYVAIFLLVWAALVLSDSRGGVLSFTCQVIFIVFISLSWYSRRRMQTGSAATGGWVRWFQNSWLIRSSVAALILITVLVSVFWMGGERFASRVSKMDSEVDQLNRFTRREGWRNSWEIVKTNPWAGVGFGTFFLAIPQYQHGAGTIRLEQAHNDYVDLAVNGGVCAIALTGWFGILIIRRVRKGLRTRDSYRRAVCLGATAGIISVAVHSMVDFGLQVTGIAVVFSGILVLAIGDERVERDETPSAANLEREFRPHNDLEVVISKIDVRSNVAKRNSLTPVRRD